MSVVGKKPFVNQIISNCSAEQINSVLSLMDNLGTPTPVALFGQQNLLSSSNIGVSYVMLQIEELSRKVCNGILVYIDNDNCGFFGFIDNASDIFELKIDPVSKKSWRVYEHLTIEELRQVCGDALGGGGAVDLTYATNAEIDALFGILPTTYPIYYDLTGCYVNDEPTEALEGSTFSVEIYPNNTEGYEWSFVQITMGGNVITEGAWNASTNTVTVENVTADVSIILECTNPVAGAWNVQYNMAGCWAGSGAESHIPYNDPLDFNLYPDYQNYEWQSVSIYMDTAGDGNYIDITSTAWQPDNNNRVYIQSVTGNVTINALCIEIQPSSTWQVDYTLTNAAISGGRVTEVENGNSLSVTIQPDGITNIGYRNCDVIMDGVYITSEVVDESTDDTIIYIPSVTGDVSIEVEYQEDEDEPEDVLVESIEFTNLPEDHSIELNVGDTEDMSQYIEVSPNDATDPSYTLTTDAPSVLSVNGTTITVLQGSEGLSANLTVTANDGSGCYDVMIVSVLNSGDDDPDEPEDVPIESIRYTDGQGNTCVGFGMLEGESVDLWTNLRILPAGYTDGVDFVSNDDTVIEVDGGGTATAVGTSGESTIITISSMENPSIYTTVEISITMDEPDDEDEEE